MLLTVKIKKKSKKFRLLYRYEDTNTEKLRRAAAKNGVETNMFQFDPKCINWEDYLVNTHLPGVVKYVFK